MTSTMGVVARGASMVLGLVAFAAGLLAGACYCEVEPIPNGTYVINDSPERAELLGATVEISDEFVEIRFADVEGNEWVVSYLVESL